MLLTVIDIAVGGRGNLKTIKKFMKSLTAKVSH